MISDYWKMPESSYLLFLLWAICIIISWYFFRHSNLKNRFGFIKIFSIISILFFFIFSYTGYKNRTRFSPIRIAIFPFSKQLNNNAVFSWESIAFSEIPTNTINKINPDKLLAYPLDWIKSAINLDSLVYPEYMKDFSNRVKANYSVIGTFVVEDSHYNVQFQLYNIKNKNTIFEKKSVIESNAILDFCDSLSRDIAENILKPKETGTVSTTWDSFPDYEDFYESKLYLLTNQLKPAYEIARGVVKHDSSSNKWLNFLADFYIKHASEKKERDLDPLMDFRAAKSLLLKVSNLKSNSTTLRLLGELYSLNERWSEAEKYLRQSFNLNQLDPNVYMNLSQLHPSRYKDLGFNNEIALLNRAISINPCFIEAQLKLADYYILKNRYNLARKIVDEVLRINPDNVDGLMASGKIYLAMNDILNVLEAYKKVIELDPDNGDAYYNLGIVYYHQKDFDHAIKFFERAIKLNDHLDSRLYLAYIYELNGENDKAIEYLRTRIRKRKNKDDKYAEEARKHLFKLMSKKGQIDSLMSKSLK